MLKHNITAAAPDIHHYDQVRFLGFVLVFFQALFESIGMSALSTNVEGKEKKKKWCVRIRMQRRSSKRNGCIKGLQLPPLAGSQSKGLALEKGSTRVALLGLYTRRWARLFLQ